jgi:type IV secretory pathway ATPase VirB11/archaellum biosynthesis ATPase
MDPDIVLVGEIRDRETADLAINAAMTGHLVFSLPFIAAIVLKCLSVLGKWESNLI